MITAGGALHGFRKRLTGYWALDTMLKFVRHGDAGHPQDERASVSVAAVSEPKDEDHDCTVCKTRRRSLERQTAHVLRRSRSRETLRSISNSSNTNEDVCINEHSKMSQDVNSKQVGEGGWSVKRDKYRRLSKSCEALSTSNKSTRWKRDDIDENVNQPKNGFLSRIKPGKTGKIGGSPLCKDLKISAVNSKKDESSIHKDKAVNRQAPCSQTLTTDCKIRQLSVKETGYTRGLCHDERDLSGKSPTGLSKSQQEGGAASTAKQVQFGGVEYEKSKEESVMGKLRNVVSGNRRKLRSRSLERIDRREEWNAAVGLEERMSSCSGRVGRSQSKSWLRDDKSMTLSVKPQRSESERDMAGDNAPDYEYQHQRRNCKRRSRSRSKEDKDRMSKESETRQGEGHLYHYGDNQQFVSSQSALSRDENWNRNRRPPSSDNKLTSDHRAPTTVRIYDLQHNTPTCSDSNPGSGSQQGGRNYHSKRREENTSLISPQYVAPNGHYGNAVVRKCHREQKQTFDTSRNNVNVLKLEGASNTGEAAFSSGQNIAAKTKSQRDNVRWSSIPKLEKCGISAKKIAKLDSPLKIKTPDLSSVDSTVDASTISIMHFRGGETTSDGSPIQERNQENMPNLSKVESNTDGILDSSTSSQQLSSSGYVYNCTTAKITKLNQPQTGNDYVQRNSKPSIGLPQNQNDEAISTTEEKITSSITNQGSFPGDSRKIEAHNLARHASIASLSLISVNSVDSGTSCHEGSTTDSSASSDKEMETQGKPHASLRKLASKSSSTNQWHEKEARQYTASAKELEQLILASCFGRGNKHGARLVTSDYESDNGPDGVRNGMAEDGRRRKGGVSRVVRFVGGKNEMDVAKEIRRKEQPLKPKGQISSNSKKSATNISHQFPDQSTNNHLTKLTTKAHVLHSHKALTKAEMSVQRGDVVYLAPEDFEQRPLWVVVYCSYTRQMGLIPSVYLTTSETARGPSLC